MVRTDGRSALAAGSGDLTPEMIDAGVIELIMHDARSDDAREIVANVYRAMRQFAPASRVVGAEPDTVLDFVEETRRRQQRRLPR